MARTGHFNTPSRQSAFADDRSRFEAGKFGMWIFLASLAVLFVATIIGYAVMRWYQPAIADLDLPALPATLWLSTAILLASSGTMHWAWCGTRDGRIATVRAGLLVTTLLGAAFLATQGYAWLVWHEALIPILAEVDDAERRFAAMAFYVLTGIHAAHVIGGLVPLCTMTIMAIGRSGSSSPRSPVYYVAMYWHFLDAVWIVLFTSLLVGG